MILFHSQKNFCYLSTLSFLSSSALSLIRIIKTGVAELKISISHFLWNKLNFCQIEWDLDGVAMNFTSFMLFQNHNPFQLRKTYLFIYRNAFFFSLRRQQLSVKYDWSEILRPLKIHDGISRMKKKITLKKLYVYLRVSTLQARRE